MKKKEYLTFERNIGKFHPWDLCGSIDDIIKFLEKFKKNSYDGYRIYDENTDYDNQIEFIVVGQTKETDTEYKIRMAAIEKYKKEQKEKKLVEKRAAKDREKELFLKLKAKYEK